MNLLLFYTYVPDMAEKRMPHRVAHLKHIKAAFERGELKMAGAYGDPLDGATLYFTAASKSVVENWVKADPYFLAGLVTQHVVREWITVIGENASVPLPPGV